MAEGCVQSGAALIGGETAEHPGLMPEKEYDLAGFAVGVIDKKDLITGEELNPGDVLIGMASTGVHSNGFSLVRKVFEMTRESLDTHYDELGRTLGEALLVPTRIYVKALKSIKEAGVRIQCMQPYHRRRFLREYSAYAERRNTCSCRKRQLSGSSDFSNCLQKKDTSKRK